MKDAFIILLLMLSLAGFIFGAFYQGKLIKAGGQRGFRILSREQMSSEARYAFRRMKIGIALFGGAVALAGFISSLWGPVRF